MDGFRERMGRGSSDRYERSDRFDDSRYDRGSRRGGGGYGSAMQGGPMGGPQGMSASIDEIAQVVDESNAKQLNVLGDMAEDTKDYIYSSEQKIKNSIEALQKSLDSVSEEITESVKKIASETKVPDETPKGNDYQDEIVRIARDNNDLLSQFAEEQLSMLVRGNSSMLSQISNSLDEKDVVLKEILNKVQEGGFQQTPIAPLMPVDNNEEVLQTAINNNTLLNALRAEVAGIQSELRDSQQARPDDNSPLDATPVTKEEMDLLYRDMEEHVHKECVKVYKNVQAALETQNAAVGDSVKKGTGGLKFLLIFNLILSVISILLSVATALQII